MIGIRVTVPVACFRRGLAREYLETEDLPPPSTVYGFLLSLVGETDRSRHIGAGIAPVLISAQSGSVVLRTLWRVKDRGQPPGCGKNARPDYQQMLTSIELVVWLDSSEERQAPKLEERVKKALDPALRNTVERFGGLSLGESTHLVNEVDLFPGDESRSGQAFLLSARGRLTLPVWVDHVGSAGTCYVVGDLEQTPLIPPAVVRLPRIRPAPGV